MPLLTRPRRGLFRDLPREVAILSAIAFTVALGFGIVSPDIPAFARHFGVSTAAAASVVSAFALMRILGALPAGRLVGRFGERAVMAAGIAIVAASSVMAGFSGSFAELIVLRGAGGLGSAMFGVSAQTLLLVSVPGESRGRASGLYAGGFLVGGISGPALGGLVAAWSMRAPFVIYGGMLVIPAVIAAALLRPRPRPQAPATAGRTAASTIGTPAASTMGTPAASTMGATAASTMGSPAGRTAENMAERTAGGTFAGIATALRDRAYRAAAAANLADGFGAIGVRSAIVPLFVRDVLHRSAVWTGIGFGVVAVLNAATLLPGGRLADRLGRRPVMVAGCLISTAGLLLLALVPGLAGYLAALAILGLGSGLLDVGPAAVIGDILCVGPGDDSRDRPASGQGGTVVASYQMAGDIGAVTGPVAAGYLVDTASYTTAFGLAAGVFGLAAMLGLFAPETRWRQQAPAAPEAADSAAR